MDSVLTSFLFGIGGGFVRTGFLFLEAYRQKRVSYKSFFIVAMTFVLGGGLGGIIFNISWPFSVLGGFASVDLLSSITKIFKKRKIKIKS